MLRVATRSSPLALAQVDLVAAALGRPLERVIVSTTGDERQDVDLRELGGQGVFVKEVQAAVLDGRADLAVHSAKDLPSSLVSALTIAAYLPRADPRDCLVGTPWDQLAQGATVATGSVRRMRLLAELRPDLRFVPLRGNMARRLAQVPPGGAVVAARAALIRLGWDDRCASTFSTAELLPQVGQGAIAIECREGSAASDELAQLNDGSTAIAVGAERAFLACLGSGCDLPVAAHATVVDGVVELHAWVGSEDPGRGAFRREVRRVCRGPADAEGLGTEIGLAARQWRFAG